ncbi:hypothetical protein D3C72_2337850 [compost metagenome]
MDGLLDCRAGLRNHRKCFRSDGELQRGVKGFNFPVEHDLEQILVGGDGHRFDALDGECIVVPPVPQQHGHAQPDDIHGGQMPDDVERQLALIE